MKNFLASLKKVINKQVAYNLLDHLKDYKLVYSIVVLVSSLLGLTMDSEKVSHAIVNGATVVASIMHTLLG